MKEDERDMKRKNSTPPAEEERVRYCRAFPDRRKATLQSFLFSFFRTRRKGPRRQGELNKKYFPD